MAQIDETAAFSGTMAVRSQHVFDVARLEAWMAENVEGFEGPLSVEQFKGGQSNPTYKLTAKSGEYVMRRKPPGKLLPSAHAVDREYKAIAALSKVDFPVARAYGLCQDDRVLGSAFYVMGFVDGRIIWDQTLPNMEKAERAAIYDAMNETMARLHKVDYQAIGLGDFGKPGNYFTRQIDRWTKQYKASETETIEAMDRLIEWLPGRVPATETTTIVHGDYRLDNMIFHKTEPRVIAVLDWELSTLGDPLADFSYHAMAWRLRPELFRGVAGIDFKGLGIPTEEEYVAAYCRRTGRDRIDNWDFYLVYNMFRIAGILQGIMGRVVAGTAASAQAAEMGARVRPIAEQAWALAQTLDR